MITDFIKVAMYALRGVASIQKGAEALGDANIWATMFQPVIDAASDPEEKKRLEALANAVALRILLGEDNFKSLQQNKDSLGTFLRVLPGEYAGAARAAINGGGLPGSNQEGFEGVFNEQADKLYLDYQREKARLQNKGVGLVELTKSVYVKTEESLALSESSYEQHRLNRGKRAQSFAEDRIGKTVARNMQEEQSGVVTKYTKSASARHEFHETFLEYLNQRNSQATPVRLRFGSVEVLAAPGSVSKRWKQFNEIKQVTSNPAMRQKLFAGNSRAGARKDLKEEVAILEALNKKWSEAKAFIEKADDGFKSDTFPVGKKTKMYDAVLVLAAFAVKQYKDAGRGEEIKGMNIYRLASLVRWDDIGENLRTVNEADLAGYFTPTQIDELKQSQIARNDFTEKNFVVISSASDKQASELEQHTEAVEMFSGMEEYFKEEEKYLLDLIGKTALDLANRKIPDGETKKKISERLTGLCLELQKLQQNRSPQVQPAPIPQQLQSKFPNQYHGDVLSAVERGLTQATESTPSRKAKTIKRSKTWAAGIETLKIKAADIKKTLDVIEKDKTLKGSPLHKDLLKAHERANKKIHDFESERQASGFGKAARDTKMFFRYAASGISSKFKIKDQDQKLMVISSTLDVAESLGNLMLADSSVTEIVEARALNEGKLAALKIEYDAKVAELQAYDPIIEAHRKEQGAIVAKGRTDLQKLERDYNTAVQEIVQQGKPAETSALGKLFTSKNKRKEQELISAKAASQGNTKALSELKDMYEHEKKLVEEEVKEKSKAKDAQIAEIEKNKQSLSSEVDHLQGQMTACTKNIEKLDGEKSKEELVVELHQNLVIHDSLDVNHPMQSGVEANMVKAAYPTPTTSEDTIGKHLPERGRARSSSTSTDDSSWETLSHSGKDDGTNDNNNNNDDNDTSSSSSRRSSLS